VADLHRALGQRLTEVCGISRHAAGLRRGLEAVAALSASFHADLCLPESGSAIQPELEKALRLEDFLGLADLMLRDALAREESCGAHFREEHQSATGEALRDDARFAEIAAWEHDPTGPPRRHAEPLHFEHVHPVARDYR
jgi:succinate dehydrogenase / fumarate reductase flavoprotein subunit